MAEDGPRMMNSTMRALGPVRWYRYAAEAADAYYGQAAAAGGGPTNGKLVRVPGICWHGIKNISDGPSMHIHFVNRLYEYTDPDEERRPWNDDLIV